MSKLFRSEQFILNFSGQKVTVFPIEDGENIEEGNLVVVNTRTLEASTPKKKSGYYAVGRAVRIVFNEYGKKMVICKDGIFIVKNAKEPKHQISISNKGRVCYFDENGSVTLDNINTTKAGIIMDISNNNTVIVQISVDEGGLEW